MPIGVPPDVVSSETTESVEADPSVDVDVEETDWVRQVASGDGVALRALVVRYQDRIFGFCYRMLQDRAEAEDVAQEVFVTLYRHAHTFRGESRVSTWLYRIAKNQALNRLKYLERRGRGTQTSMDGLTLVDPNGGPDKTQESRELWQRVHEALGSLEADFRTVVVLRDLEGLSYDEITEITGLARGTVKSRIHRGRTALAVRLQRYVKDE